MMNKIQNKFENLFSTGRFRLLVVALHVSYIFFIGNLVWPRWSVPLQDLFFLFGTGLIAFYWKLFARMKKKQYENESKNQ